MIEKSAIAICIPTYNRPEMTMDSFSDVYNTERIGEIVIVDDNSAIDNFRQLSKLINGLYPTASKVNGSPLNPVKLFRNLTNLDCYRNKMKALSLSKTNWCILLDSDNKIGLDYLERIFSYEEWKEDTIYQPSFASPHFDFRAFEGLLITKENVASYMDKPMFETMLNAANYFVNRNSYLHVWDDSIDPVTSDSIYMAYRWLSNGGKIKVVPGLTYQHRVHDSSHYKTNVHRTPHNFHQDIINKLKNLK